MHWKRKLIGSITALLLGGVVVTATTLVPSSSRANMSGETTVVMRELVDVGINLSNDNQTMYVEFVGSPVTGTSCENNGNVLKMDVDDPDRSNAYELAFKLLVAAKAGDQRVKLSIPHDECVYGYPTFNSVYLVSSPNPPTP